MTYSRSVFQYSKYKNYPVLKEKAYKGEWKYTSIYSSPRHWIGVDNCNPMSTYPPPLIILGKETLVRMQRRMGGPHSRSERVRKNGSHASARNWTMIMRSSTSYPGHNSFRTKDLADETWIFQLQTCNWGKERMIYLTVRLETANGSQVEDMQNKILLI